MILKKMYILNLGILSLSIYNGLIRKYGIELNHFFAQNFLDKWYLKEVEKRNKNFYELLVKNKINGIFTSPPYVGQIDYHEQHAYAYDLFGFERKDNLEIAPLCNGHGSDARVAYVDGICKVLLKCRKFLADFSVFLVANDKYNLYPAIAELAGMKIMNQFKRPVLNRTERDKSPYSEMIFFLKDRK